MTPSHSNDFWTPLSSLFGFITLYLTSLQWAINLDTVEVILKDTVLFLSMVSLIITIYNATIRKSIKD